MRDVTRKELRRRHPGLKVENNNRLDEAIMTIPHCYFGAYTSIHMTVLRKDDKRVDQLLEVLDQPAKAALIDYLETMTADVKERLAKLPPAE